METINILVSDPLAEEGLQILRSQKNFKVDTLANPPSEDKLKDIIVKYDGLVVRSGTKVTKNIIESGKKLKLIARAGVGIDNVNVEASTKKGILVVNAPEGNTISTAELTMSLILALARKISWAHQSILDGKWDRKKFKGGQLYGRTLGIIGLGRIGFEVASRARAFGMHIIGYDPYLSKDKADSLPIELKSLENIYQSADIITVHTPLTTKTKGMVSKKEIEMMKSNVLLINCARGGIYVENDVEEALSSCRIGGAAFDVFEKEPPNSNNLLSLPNFLSTPHLGASTQEAQISVAIETADAVVDFFTKGITRNSLNFPSISPDIFEANKPFLLLCEKLGYLLAALREGHMEELTIIFSAEMESKPIHVMKLAALKGFLEPILSEGINFVNAISVAKDRGIPLREVLSSDSFDFPEMVTLRVKTDKGFNEVSGTIYHSTDPRIIGVNGYDFEIEPSGNYLLIKNKDMPGVVGIIGTILAEDSVNIATMQLGRKDKGSEAMIFIKVDDNVNISTINKIKSHSAIIDAIPLSF